MNALQAQQVSKKQTTKPIVIVLIGIGLIVLGATVFHSTEIVPAEGIRLNIGKIIANIGVFLAFIQLLNTFFYQPLSQAIHERTTELEETYSEADQLKSQMQKMRTEYESQLAATEATAREQIQAQIHEAQALRLQIMKEASDHVKELKIRAEEEIEFDRKKALHQLRVQVVDLTLSATEQLIHKNVDNEVNRKLVDEFIEKLEVVPS